LVGAALLSAALSIVVNRFVGLSAMLLGIMIFCFVVLIHIPRLAAKPDDRIALAVVLRDLAFSAGALALASSQANQSWQAVAQRIIPIARCIIACGMLFFGVEHFLHPDFVPVVPLGLAMPGWVPLHSFVSYAVGTALLAAGLAMLANWHARLAAFTLGSVVFAVVLLIYLPILVSNPSDIAVAMNYFADTLMVGGDLWVLAYAIPRRANSPLSSM
jgi:uncharacterized membrane protein